VFFRRQFLQRKLLKFAHEYKCAFDLCQKASEILDKPIHILTYPRFPADVKGSVFELDAFYLIFLRPTLPRLSNQLALLHELSHIFLEHLNPISIDELALALASATYFTHPQERAAQKFACKLLNRLINLTQLSPPNPPEFARYEQLFK
jgi:hypothetical protein